jgi:hypothetical protein
MIAGSQPRALLMRRLIRFNLQCVLLSLAIAGAGAQSPAPDRALPRSGDAWVDRTLADIDRFGARYPDAFVDELTRYHGAPRALVESLLSVRQLGPGDLYFACALAQVAGQPCRAVVERWQHDPGQGWGAVAQAFGIAPGSAQLERIKQALRASYARWGRPPVAEDAVGKTINDGKQRGH